MNKKKGKYIFLKTLFLSSLVLHSTLNFCSPKILFCSVPHSSKLSIYFHFHFSYLFSSYFQTFLHFLFFQLFYFLSDIFLFLFSVLFLDFRKYQYLMFIPLSLRYLLVSEPTCQRCPTLEFTDQIWNSLLRGQIVSFSSI